MNTNFKNLFVIGPAILLSACKSEISPEWESYYSHAQSGESRVEWLSNIAVDTYGDIISAGSTVLTGADRQQNILFVKHDDDGDVLWSADFDMGRGQYRSDDKVTDMVLDDEGNTYAVGVRYIVENEQQRYGSFILKLNDYGELQWVRELSTQEDARDIEIHNGQLYVTGYATQIFNIDGDRLLELSHDKAWDIEVAEDGSFYIVGATRAQKFFARGEHAWSVDLQPNLYQQASLALNDDGSILVAHNQEDDSSRVSRISNEGVLEWSKTYQPAAQSYGFPGPALVKTDWRGDVILSLSNDKGRRIVKLDEYGREDWQVTGQGIVQDFAIGVDSSVYVIGGGVNEKYDANGEFIAQTTATANTQITTGSIALDGGNMYVGYSAVNNSDIQLYLAKFIDE